MLESTEVYKESIIGNKRRIFLKAVVDISDPDLSFVGVTGDQEDFSQPQQLYDKDFEINRYATLEKDRWALDGSFAFIPEQGDIPKMGFVGTELSQAGGEFLVKPYAELKFENVSVLQACCVYFSDDPLDGVAADFIVEVEQGGTVYYTKEIQGNSKSSILLDKFTVNNPDTIRVTVSKWSLPYRRPRIVEIVPGIYEEWGNPEIASFSASQQADISCLTTPYGICTLSMDNANKRFEPRSKTGLFKSIEDRQGIDIYIGVQLPDGTIDYKPIGRYYQFSGGWKTGDNSLSMKWNLVDIVGLLANRAYVHNGELPTTLDSWVKAIVSQLGENFYSWYTVDPGYADKPVTVRSLEDLSGRKCGEILRYVCMATGTWPRADSYTGKLIVEPLWSEGNKLTLDNMDSYPGISANDDVAALIFTLNDEDKTQYIVSGTSTASNVTVSIDNPFIKTKKEALIASKLILATYGGNKIEVSGRGDPASEIGDVDTVWLDKSTATTGRRVYQQFNIKEGVLQGCKSTLLQADGSFLYENRVVITSAGLYKAPESAGELRIILVGKGQDGATGSDGTWEQAGSKGQDGSGGKVWSNTIMINPGQEFEVKFEGENTLFGPYSSAQGRTFPYGYTDIQSGDSFARTGVTSPLPGSGDGGTGGTGGIQGNKYEEEYITQDGIHRTEEVIVNYPGSGQLGATGAQGCVVVYWGVQ